MALMASLDKILFWDTIVSFPWLCLQMCSENNLLVVHFARRFSPSLSSDNALINDVPYPLPYQFSNIQLTDVVVTANGKCER